MTGKRRTVSLRPDLALASELLDRLVRPLLLVAVTCFLGTFGYYFIGHGRWSLLDCAYMTSITLTTVGYGEILDQMGPDARTFSMGLMWVGMGVTLYAVSTVTAFVVEKNFTHLLKERRMEKRIAAMKGHVIVCGAGRIGSNVIRELYVTKHPCVVIEGDPDRIAWAQEHFKDLCILRGDATEEEALKRAGIARAVGVVATLNDDSHNLLITVQARYANPKIKIVARCDENNRVDKFYYAGANYVVNPTFIGGMRMASEMLRPNVVAFLDRMLRGLDPSTRVEEAVVAENSEWAGLALQEADIYGNTGLTPIAIKQPGQKDFTYNPPPTERLQPETVIVAIGTPIQINLLKKFCGSEVYMDETSEEDGPKA
ncbi:MAG: TrkA family potassium uptake protein [Syntrophobacteraceae bacterium]